MGFTELMGWCATAVFVASYFTRPDWMRRIQAMGALIWIVYGVLLGAPPVIVANLLVLGAAAWTTWRLRSSPTPDGR